MEHQDNKDRLEYIEKSYAIAVENFPEHAAPAKELVIDYLTRYAPERLSVYIGEQADKDYDGCNMDIAHYFICGLLQQQANGNTKVTDEQIDILARKYLELPEAVIDNINA